MTRDPHQLRNVRIHVTGASIASDGTSTSEVEIAETLARLSVYDCLRFIGRLSAELYIDNKRTSIDAQKEMVERVVAPVAPTLGTRLIDLLSQGEIAFFEQQLYHVARLSLLHADLRDPDGFSDGRGASDFLFCLFGATDAFEDLTKFDSDDVLSWGLRQGAMNREEERLILWGFYFDLFNRIWPTLSAEGDPDDAFRRYTGLSINDYIALGLACATGFSRRTGEGPYFAELDPSAWFSASKVPEAKWRRFLEQASATPEELRDALLGEEKELGGSRYLSLALERAPIVAAPDGTLFVANFPALERRATHGIFHILAEGAVNEGGPRELHTNPFGQAFQLWAERSIRRAEEQQAEPAQIFADVEYGPKSSRRQTPDVVLRYERALVCVEVVAGPMRIRTLTHGDLESFELDLEKLVFKKAHQLNERIAEILNGDAEDVGLDSEGVARVWPVIVTAAQFPVELRVMEHVRARLKEKRLLQGKLLAPISVVTAEELAAAEGELIETGTSLVRLLSDWKRHEATGDHSLKNFLFDRAAGRGATIPVAEHHSEAFDEAVGNTAAVLFGTQPSEYQAAKLKRASPPT